MQLTCHSCHTEVSFAKGEWTHTDAAESCPLLIVNWPDPPLFDKGDKAA